MKYKRNVLIMMQTKIELNRKNVEEITKDIRNKF